jgi:hypothetical protein
MSGKNQSAEKKKPGTGVAKRKSISTIEPNHID